MGLRKAFSTSKKLETEGITLDLGFCRMVLARAGGSNKDYLSAMEKVHKQHSRAIQLGAMSDNRMRDILYEVYADTVVKSWETNLNEEGDEPDFKPGIENIFEEDATDLLPFTRENVIAVFKAMPDLFVEVKTTAENISFYRESLVEDAVKNS